MTLKEPGVVIFDERREVIGDLHYEGVPEGISGIEPKPMTIPGIMHSVIAMPATACAVAYGGGEREIRF